MSWQLSVLRIVLRRIVRPALGHMPDPLTARRWFERTVPVYAPGQHAARLISDRVRHGGQEIAVEWTAPACPDAPIILYFHGGGYVMGSPRTHAALACRLTRETEIPICLPKYRLAPEYPFPAAFEDALLAWNALRAQGHAARNIVLGGDSAGGGLALALLAHLCSEAAPSPACCFVFSPFVDLTCSGASITENADRELVLPDHRIPEICAHVLAGADPHDARISPLFGNFQSASPVFVQAAQTELLRDDSCRMAAKLRHDGADVTLQLWGDLPHAWHIYHVWLPEARMALRAAASFIIQHTRSHPSADS